jgi:phenylacetate-coenzyme A ligase PaaK-like adenylate-forming protein
MRSLRPLLEHASTAPFFRRKVGALAGRTSLKEKDFLEKIPLTTLEELVHERLANGDPYASRWAGGEPPLVALQLEYDTEAPLYVGFGAGELRGYAEALRRCWSLLGLGQGDSVGIFDYGTSPVSYLASSAFTPYLRRGAADALRCLPVCNDGGANMSERAVEIVKFVRPRVLFVRADCLHPFALEIEKQSLDLSAHIAALVAAENEALLPQAEREMYERRLGVPIYRMLRIDAAMFLAVECPQCRLLHSWHDLYLVESLAGPAGDEDSVSLVITNRFARSCPTIRYVAEVKGSLRAPGCPAGPKDIRITA